MDGYVPYVQWTTNVQSVHMIMPVHHQPLTAEFLAQYRPAEHHGPFRPPNLCKICNGVGEVPYENWKDVPSQNTRPCAACGLNQEDK